MTVRTGGRVDALDIEATGPDAQLEVSYRFRRWNREADITAPAKSQIDPTPFIEEEDVAGFGEAALFQPAAIPRGWILDSADVVDGSLTPEGCDQVLLSFVDPADPDVGFLELYEFPMSCSLGRVPGAEPFTAGPYQGWIHTEGGLATVELTVGDTIVQVSSDLDVEQLVRLLGELVPLDLAHPPPDSLALAVD